MRGTATTKESARTLLLRQLALAAELEHGLCLQYLFTACSLKSWLAEGGLTQAELTYVRKWKANIFFVAAQEMLHLVQVANICSAVGGVVQLHRPNFPQRPNYYPTGLPWGLWPFSEAVMGLYALYERPAQWERPVPDWLEDSPDKASFAGLLTDSPAEKDPFAHLPERFDRPRVSEHETIGELYRAIEQLLDEPGMIIGNPRDQVDGRTVDFPQLVQVIDEDSARRAVHLIVEQGEGAPADRADSHFGIFLGVIHEFRRLVSDRAGFAPARDVQANPLSRLHVDNTFPGWRLIENVRTRDVNDLSSSLYRLLLRVIHHLVMPPEESLPRPVLAEVGLHLMTAGVKPLAELMTFLPMGDEQPGGDEDERRFAGASFEVHEVVVPPVATSMSRQDLGNAISGLATWAFQLADGARGSDDTLRSVGSTLEQIAESLLESPVTSGSP